MRSATQSTRIGAKRLGFLALAACTVWLVIQNTLLVLAVTWGDPAKAGRVVLALLKAAALVMAGFWTSPAAAALVALALVLLVVRARPTPVASREARHG
jgi:hypothetical protein